MPLPTPYLCTSGSVQKEKSVADKPYFDPEELTSHKARRHRGPDAAATEQYAVPAREHAVWLLSGGGWVVSGYLVLSS
jgi:hypothetical protein